MSKADKLAEKAAETVKKAGKKISEMTSKASENAATLNGKVIDHAEENARSAFAAMRLAAASTTLQELAQVQAEFIKDQGTRSMTQVREVGDLIAQFGKDAMSAWRKDEAE